MPVYPLRKYKYWIETLSTLALSPREQHAFTQTGRDFTMEDIEQQASENLKKKASGSYIPSTNMEPIRVMHLQRHNIIFQAHLLRELYPWNQISKE